MDDELKLDPVDEGHSYVPSIAVRGCIYGGLLIYQQDAFENMIESVVHIHKNNLEAFVKFATVVLEHQKVKWP